MLNNEAVQMILSEQHILRQDKILPIFLLPAKVPATISHFYTTISTIIIALCNPFSEMQVPMVLC